MRGVVDGMVVDVHKLNGYCVVGHLVDNQQDQQERLRKEMG